MAYRLTVDEETVREAMVEAVEKSGDRNFEQSVELIMTTRDLDISKPENRIRLTLALPTDGGKPQEVCVFADGITADKAEEAGASRVIGSSELEELSGEKREIKKIADSYDYFLAEPPLMKVVGQQMGFALGPRGKTPDILPPGADVEEEIEKAKRTVRIYLRNRPEAMCAVGSEEADPDVLAENAIRLIRAFNRELREKGRIGKIIVKTTMGSPVRVV